MKAFSKVFKSEFKSQFSIAIIVGIIIASLVPLIAPLATSELKATANQSIENVTFSTLSRMLGETVIYTLILRLVMIFREKTTVDRNRALYIKYNKNTVLLGKTFVDMLIFMSSIILVAFLGTTLTVYKNHGKLSPEFLQNIFPYIIALMCMYLVMSMGIRWAISSIDKKVYRGLAIFGIVMLTAGLYAIMGIVEGVVTSPKQGGGITFTVMELIKDNKYVFAFIPFLNISIIPMLVAGSIETWTIVPFIIEMLIIVALLWKTLAKNLKTYLAT